MDESSEFLERIALALEAALAEPATTSLSPWTTLFIGTILGGVLGAIGRYLVWEYQQAKLKADKRILFSGLIGDEITHRWTSRIGADFTALFAREFAIKEVREFCNDIIIREHDLPVFKMAYERALDLNVFYERRVISHMVYIHVKSKDLCDAQNYMSKLLEAYDQETDDDKRSKLGELMEGNWEYLGREVALINEESELVHRSIECDYRKFTNERAPVHAPG